MEKLMSPLSGINPCNFARNSFGFNFCFFPTRAKLQIIHDFTLCTSLTSKEFILLASRSTYDIVENAS